ncbi:FecCD family ABC transporter permease [Salirhabdus sp. Marseille-P4669]|uniref:FecCD family ABC transporter permease n=1 Tax=Salirhabdus sp. Marseille-P4669 TaxID=2042310 RepID=UPI000C7BC0E6|nr:iron ABC transporter permease [Salirhabdus sp. Marseille-P4669]
MNFIRSIPFPIKLITAVVFLLLSMSFAIRFGAASTSVQDVWNAIWAKNGGTYYSELREIRFPRVLAAFFVGSALAVAGAIMQGITRNPLADPGLLGITAGANAALAITLALLPSSSYLQLIIACFIGAGIGMAIVFLISTATQGGLSPLKLVLAGAAVTAFLQALADGIGILFHISKDVSMWTSGGLIGTTWSSLFVVPFILIGLTTSLFLSGKLTVLSLNEDVAVGLGQKTSLLKIILMVLVVILAGSSVALVGNLAFLGLMIPHMVRALVGSDYRFILPMSIVIGGLFMVCADLIGRTIYAPFETPVVALISLIGLPFFLILVRKGGRQFE